MPRPIVLGNGKLLVCLDDHGRIRDLTYPHPGQPNHLSGHSIRLGIWADGHLSWLDGPAWHRSQHYVPDQMTGVTTYRSPGLGLLVEVEDSMMPVGDALFRDVKVTNLRTAPRDLRLFSTHDLRINESDIGDTALYHPASNSIIHYKGSVAFAFGAWSDLGGIKQYATGIKAFNGLEGTWRDAEDGELHNTPIEQGSVDSTLRVDLRVEGESTAEAHLVIAAAHDLVTATELSSTLQITDSRSMERWTEWVEARTPDLSMLPEEVRALFRRSLLIVRTQCDVADGGILAATDSDIMETARAHYGYVWPRDGALVAMLFDELSDDVIPQQFFRFCDRALAGWPFFLQKYNPDGSLGSTWHPWIFEGKPSAPRQDDETALVLLAACRHPDSAWRREHWERFMAPMADFLAENQDPASWLQRPSYDLWEERRGVHTFTTACAIAALSAAAEAAEAIDDSRAAEFRSAAEAMKDTMLDKLVEPGSGAFLRRLGEPPDRTIDASTLHVGLLGVLEPRHEAVMATVEAVRERLSVRGSIEGIARYEGDHYFRRSDAHTGNIWVICTLWLAQAEIAMAKDLNDLHQPLETLLWAVERSGPTYTLAEQYDPDTGRPLSVSPLTWSHAEFMTTCLRYAARWHDLQSQA